MSSYVNPQVSLTCHGVWNECLVGGDNSSIYVLATNMEHSIGRVSANGSEAVLGGMGVGGRIGLDTAY